jgi:uncharacterized membrane protein
MDEGAAPEPLARGLKAFLALPVILVALFVATGPWKIGERDVGRLSAVLTPAAQLFLIALVKPSWRHALFRFFREREIRFSSLSVILATGVASLFLCRVVFGQWMSLDINAWDTGVLFDGPIFETLAGRPFYCALIERSALSLHGSYLLLAFVPLYAIAASPVWLLAAHAAAIAAAAALSFLLFRRMLSDDLAAAFVAAGFLLNTYTARIAQYGFHLEVFYLPALFLLLYAYAARRPALFAAAVLLAVSIKEDAVLPLGGFALAAVIFDRRWRPGAFALATSLAAFLVGTRIVIPHFSGEPAGRPWYWAYWAAYGETPVAAAVGMLRHPVRLAGDLARSGLPHLLEPLLLLPVAGYQWFLAALPALVAYSVSSNPGLSQFSIYYSAPVLPFLFAAAAGGLWRVTRFFEAGRNPDLSRRRLGALLLFAVCALDGAGYRFTRPDPARADVGPAVASLSGRPVAVQGSLLVHAGHGRAVRVLRFDHEPGPQEAILLAPRTNPYPYTRQNFDALVRRLLTDPHYRHTESSGGLLLFTPMD